MQLVNTFPLFTNSIQYVWHRIHRDEYNMSNTGTRLWDARIEKGLNRGKLVESLQSSRKAIPYYENKNNLDNVYDFAKNLWTTWRLYKLYYYWYWKSNDKEITLQEQQIISAYRELADSDKRIVDFVLVTSENDMSKAILKLQIFKGFLKSFPHNVPSTIILHWDCLVNIHRFLNMLLEYTPKWKKGAWPFRPDSPFNNAHQLFFSPLKISQKYSNNLQRASISKMKN